MGDLPYKPETLNVMVIDDHNLIRKSLTKILNKLNFINVFECANGQEAIKVYSSNVIDLVLCDIYMPKADGFEVLKFIRSRDTNSDIPFIVVTGESSKEDIVKAANLGADDYMLKPFQTPEAERKITHILTKYHSPVPAISQIRRAERLYMERDFKSAEKSCNNALQLSPKSPRGLHLSAIIKQGQGKTEEAIAILKKNIFQNPSFLKNYTSLADINLKKGDTPEAIHFLRRELEINPKQDYRQIQLAKLLEKSGDYQGAIEHYRQALLENGKNKIALFGMGRAYAANDNLEKSLYYFKRLRRHHPDNTKSLEAIVKYALEAESSRKAEIILVDEKKSFPNRLDTYLILSKLYCTEDDYDKALEVVAEALSKNPEYLEGLKVKAAIQHKIKRYDEAISTYKQILSTNNDITSYLKLAELLMLKNSYSEVIKRLHEAIRLKENTPLVLYWLAMSTLKTKQYTKAYFIYKKVVQLGFQNNKLQSSIDKIRPTLISRRQKKKNIAS